MNKEINLFGGPIPGKNNINQNFNLFGNNNNLPVKVINKQNNINMRNSMPYSRKKIGNSNSSINNQNNNNINDHQEIKIGNFNLKDSINLNIFSNDDLKIENNNGKNELNNINNNKRNISYDKYNNINNNRNMQKNFNKNEIISNNINNNNILKNNIHNNINDYINNNSKNNLNSKTVVKKGQDHQKIKEKPNLFKSVIMFDESKKKNTETNKINQREKIELLKRKKEDENNKAEIKDNLKCYICMDKLKKPRMCKYCHRAACEECLKKWLKDKGSCGFCRKRIKFEEAIDIPIIDDIANFIENLEKQRDNKNGKDIIFDSDCAEIASTNLNKDENICSKHNNKLEYFCFQCNQKYCDKCLIILNDTSKVHENHTIVYLDQMEKNENIKKIMGEYEKLKQTNLEIDHLINFCNMKLLELNIEKNNFIGNINCIENEIKTNVDKSYIYLKQKYEEIESKGNELTNIIDTTPLALNNIIKLKDYGQGKEIYDRVSNLNKYISDNENNMINIQKKNLYIETFISDYIKINLQNVNIDNGSNEKSFIYEQNYNLIPNHDIKIMIFPPKRDILYLKIKIKKKINNGFPLSKFLCFVIFRNKKYGCEFIKMKIHTVGRNELSLYSDINKDTFNSFQDENNNILYKLYFMLYNP